MNTVSAYLSYNIFVQGYEIILNGSIPVNNTNVTGKRQPNVDNSSGLPAASACHTSLVIVALLGALKSVASYTEQFDSNSFGVLNV